MYWQLPSIVILLVVVVAVLIRRRRMGVGETMQMLGQVPSGPTLPGLKYLFPGRDTPPDPGVRATPVVLRQEHRDRSLPPDVRKKS